MKAYKCQCGCIFDEPRRVSEPRGEFWGAPCSETMYYCPSCGDDCFDEVDVDDDTEIYETYADEGW